MADGSRVRLRVGTDNLSENLQSLRRWLDNGADRPDSCSAVVRALARVSRDKAEPGRQKVADLDVGGVIRTAVVNRDGKRDNVADVGSRIVDRFGNRQIGLLQRF